MFQALQMTELPVINYISGTLKQLQPTVKVVCGHESVEWKQKYSCSSGIACWNKVYWNIGYWIKYAVSEEGVWNSRGQDHIH